MYKDKDKQREANAERQRRYKAKQKALLSEGVTVKGVTGIDKALLIVKDELKQEGELIDRVVESDVLNVKPKRGKDIKCFADLPPDVQGTIDIMSTKDDGKIDKTIKANRTAIAISYQHQFPGMYYPHSFSDAGLSGVSVQRIGCVTGSLGTRTTTEYALRTGGKHEADDTQTYR